MRRSASGGSAGETGGCGRSAERGVRAAPHSPQNLCPGGFEFPQEEQTAVSAAPHWPQNFCPAGFSAPQFAHAATCEA